MSDRHEEMAETIREAFDLFFDELGPAIRIVRSASIELLEDFREALLVMAGEAFDKVAES